MYSNVTFLNSELYPPAVGRSNISFAGEKLVVLNIRGRQISKDRNY
jgi:hypothetical protein